MVIPKETSNENRIQILEQEVFRLTEASIEALRQKDVFISTISHEVRTPLNAIVGIAHLLEQDAAFHNDNRLKILKFSADNLLRLFSDLLELSKIESGRLSLNISDFSIYELTSNTFSALELQATQKGLAYEFVFDSKISPVLRGDATRLGQVINNLLTNAIKFTPKGSVRLEVILLQDYEKEQLIRFIVSDTGIGIEEENQKKVFENFFQGYRVAGLSGTGLGLGISQSILKLMGSHIRLKSAPGQGSEFSFDIKLLKAEPLSLNQTSSEQPQNLSGVKILVVEDHKASQFIVKSFLNKWKASVTLADNGLQALEFAVRDHYDLILMDLQMPVMDGYEATEALRKLEGGKYTHTPIIALTAMNVSDVKEKIVAANFSDILPKPFKPDELYRTVMAHLSQSSIAGRAVHSEGIPYLEKIDFQSIHSMIVSFFVTQSMAMEFCKTLAEDLRELKTNYRNTLLANDETTFKGLIDKTHAVLKWLGIRPLLDETQRGKILLRQPHSQAIQDNALKVEFYCDRVVSFLNEVVESLKKRELQKVAHHAVPNYSELT